MQYDSLYNKYDFILKLANQFEGENKNKQKSKQHVNTTGQDSEISAQKHENKYYRQCNQISVYRK